jgi:hypothetical protein
MALDTYGDTPPVKIKPASGLMALGICAVVLSGAARPGSHAQATVVISTSTTAVACGDRLQWWPWNGSCAGADQSLAER